MGGTAVASAGYHLLHVARAELLRRLAARGGGDALPARARARQNEAERETYLEKRLREIAS